MKKFLFAVLAICFVCVQVAVVSDSNAGSIQAQAKTPVQDWKVAPKKVVASPFQYSSINLIHKTGTAGGCSRYPQDEKKSGHYYLTFNESQGTSATEYLGRDHAKGDDCWQLAELLLADGNYKQGFLVLRTRRTNPMFIPSEYKWYMIRYNGNHITSGLMGLHPRFPNWPDACNSEETNIKHLQVYKNYLLLVEEGTRYTGCVTEPDSIWLQKVPSESIRITLYKYRADRNYLFQGDYFNNHSASNYIYERAIEKLFIYNGKAGKIPDRPLIVVNTGQYKALKEARVDAKVVNHRFVVTFAGNNKSQSFYLKTPLK